MFYPRHKNYVLRAKRCLALVWRSFVRATAPTCWAVLLLALALCMGSSPGTDGYYQTRHVCDSFLLTETPSLRKMVRIVKRHRSQRYRVLSDQALAHKILAVSRCLKIDAYAFASLICQESMFDTRAISPTRAMGLTQFTSAGIREANAQLGEGFYPRANAKTVSWFRKRIDACVVPSLQMRGFVPLWYLESYPAHQKRVLMMAPDYALIYGAVLLKTLLAVEKGRNPRGSISQHYRNALRTYNGDPRVQNRYQREVMNRARFFRNL